MTGRGAYFVYLDCVCYTRSMKSKGVRTQYYRNVYAVQGAYSRAAAEPFDPQLVDRGAHEHRAAEQRGVLRTL